MELLEVVVAAAAVDPAETTTDGVRAGHNTVEVMIMSGKTAKRPADFAKKDYNWERLQNFVFFSYQCKKIRFIVMELW